MEKIRYSNEPTLSAVPCRACAVSCHGTMESCDSVLAGWLAGTALYFGRQC